MAFKMKINGIEVEVDSVIEAGALIDLASGKKVDRSATYLPSVKEKKTRVSWFKEEMKYLMDHIDKDLDKIYPYLSRHTKSGVQGMRRRILRNILVGDVRKYANELIIEFPYLQKVVGRNKKS